MTLDWPQRSYIDWIELPHTDTYYEDISESFVFDWLTENLIDVEHLAELILIAHEDEFDTLSIKDVTKIARGDKDTVKAHLNVLADWFCQDIEAAYRDFEEGLRNG